MGFKSARQKAGIRVAEVMSELHVTDSAVYQWEMGLTVPDARKLPVIAKLYNCSIDELLEGNGDSNVT